MYNAIIFVLLFLVFCVQEFIPRLGPDASYAILLLYPVWFMCSAVTLTYPAMLGLAFFAGLLWDLRYSVMAGPGEMVTSTDLVGMVKGQAVFGMGIVFFGLMGNMMQGVRPLFLKKRLGFPILLTGAGVFAFLLLDFLFLTFKRGSFSFPSILRREMFATALVSMAFSPIFYFILHWLHKSFGYRSRYLSYGG